MLSCIITPPDMTDHRSLMDDLTGRLEVLLRLYAAADDNGQRNGAKLAERFRRDLRLLVAEYGHKLSTLRWRRCQTRRGHRCRYIEGVRRALVAPRGGMRAPLRFAVDVCCRMFRSVTPTDAWSHKGRRHRQVPVFVHHRPASFL
jgi:hypothetical protein